MKETIGMRLDSKVIEDLRQLALAQRRTLSNMAAFAVTEYVEGLRRALAKGDGEHE